MARCAGKRLATRALRRLSPPCASLILHTLYNLTLSITPAARSGLVGQVLTYTARYTNTGNVADTITLTRTNAGWPTVIVPAGQTIAPGGVRISIISVTVPLPSTLDQIDLTLIQAQGSGALVQARLSSRAIAPAAFLPIVLRN
ncbi:MAG: hypothetical protein RMN25_04505 [Anaerolineae bacterium]|nr:hypothetical protein [Thermoflexales bacterium]MDW8407024.1 hypothetical protein [Anaerolineae bacterium]